MSTSAPMTVKITKEATVIKPLGVVWTQQKPKQELIKILTENYDVENDMKPLTQFTIKQIIPELLLRGSRKK